MDPGEAALIFGCESDSLVGVLSEVAAPATRGVLIIVGGPQYRAGSHRQFTLLARYLASQGIPALRFDYRGMGDSTGPMRSFEHVTDDIRCAIDGFFAAMPALREVVIWGLCDAASAALFYAHHDPRVSGLVLANPWVRTSEGEARTYLKHYYRQRLLSPAAWRQLLCGPGSLKQAAKSVVDTFRQAMGTTSATVVAAPLPERMADGFARFGGLVLLLLSGNDLTAKEFVDVTVASPKWRALLDSPRVTRHVLPEATHTFSRREWRDQVAQWTADWVKFW